MISQGIASYLHFVSIFILVSSLIIERVLFTEKMENKTLVTISKADMWYGISTVLVITTGIVRVIYFGKGLDYYLSNHVFWTKIFLFSILGALSTYPTIKFLYWRKQIKNSGAFQMNTKQAKTIDTLIWCEIVVLLFIPLCAVLMARGIG